MDMERGAVQSSSNVDVAAATNSGNSDDRPHSSWMDEIILPEQFLGRARDSSASWTGERKLLFAVLQDAVSSLYRYRNDASFRGRRLFRETQEWFDSQDKHDLYTFEMICEYLNLDAGYIRRGISQIIQSTEPESVLLHSRPLRGKYQ